MSITFFVVGLKCRFHSEINTIYSGFWLIQILYIVYKNPEMEVLHGQSLQEMNCNATTVTSSIIS
nr:MAG TPA: hypothetical protein [Caudoviricetes sp.]